MDSAELGVFKKLPLGGVDRRALVAQLASEGPRAARELLRTERARIGPAGTTIAPDAVVLLLGGSNGLTRAIAAQLLFGEGVAVVGVHHDSEKMQIGVHHVGALGEAAAEAAVVSRFFNADAARAETVAEVVSVLRGQWRTVHLINGIAAGAPKRHAVHGPTQVLDLDVAFDPVLQVPDFRRPENIRRLGRVEVEVATAADVERTHRFMGSSTSLWAEPLAEAGLLRRDESVVGFCDYDFPPDDPVYGMGPLADAKREQRRSLGLIAERFGVRAVRLCYPPMATTAIGIIPGGLYLYAMTAQILKERGRFRTVAELAADTMALWREPRPAQELRLDVAYQQCLDEFRQRTARIRPADVPAAFSLLFEP
jgi:enoyl-[acyl-carrier protein] reductase / trans-2-enoyl-CoA reductase (NAD+)